MARLTRLMLVSCICLATVVGVAIADSTPGEKVDSTVDSVKLKAGEKVDASKEKVADYEKTIEDTTISAEDTGKTWTGYIKERFNNLADLTTKESTESAEQGKAKSEDVTEVLKRTSSQVGENLAAAKGKASDAISVYWKRLASIFRPYSEGGAAYGKEKSNEAYDTLKTAMGKTYEKISSTASEFMKKGQESTDSAASQATEVKDSATSKLTETHEGAKSSMAQKVEDVKKGTEEVGEKLKVSVAQEGKDEL